MHKSKTSPPYDLSLHPKHDPSNFTSALSSRKFVLIRHGILQDLFQALSTVFWFSHLLLTQSRVESLLIYSRPPCSRKPEISSSGMFNCISFINAGYRYLFLFIIRSCNVVLFHIIPKQVNERIDATTSRPWSVLAVPRRRPQHGPPIATDWITKRHRNMVKSGFKWMKRIEAKYNYRICASPNDRIKTDSTHQVLSGSGNV